MSKIVKVAVMCAVSALELIIVPFTAAKKPAELAAAPIPVQGTTGKKVFISYLQSDADPGAPNLTYNEFYSLMKEWGKYELATTPGGCRSGV